MKRLDIDVGSTYFKTSADGVTNQYFRDFDISILNDLSTKCASLIESYTPEQIHICSSANGGLSTLIIGYTSLFSTRFATNIAFNSGINIIDTLLYTDIPKAEIPSQRIDIVIIVGGIDGVKSRYDKTLIDYLSKLDYANILYAGNKESREFLSSSIDDLLVLENVIDKDLQVREDELKEYLTNLYQSDIIGKDDIKELYTITSNQIYSTPYIVNKALANIKDLFEVADPFLLIDIGGATTDIHYSTDLIENKNIITQSGYDRLVFKKLGVFKSRESLVFTAKNNEFVYELLDYLGVNENILEEYSDQATVTLMQLAIFLVLYKMSKNHNSYVNLKMESLNSIIFTGGISKVLSDDDIEKILRFFYGKILSRTQIPSLVIDRNYEIWVSGNKQR